MIPGSEPSSSGGNPIEGLEIRAIGAEQTYALRHQVLRSHQPIEEVAYPGDGLDTTLHLGAYMGDGDPQWLIGIVTLSVAPMPEAPEAGDHRLRGMAVDPAVQGRGVGGRLIREALDAIARRDGRRVWCNARVSALGFYRRHGFVVHGDEFEIPDIGPHYVLNVAVDPRLR
ncbi:MAG: GNAT family N-acetyltransferase [Planctomycetota bacterium]